MDNDIDVSGDGGVIILPFRKPADQQAKSSNPIALGEIPSKGCRVFVHFVGKIIEDEKGPVNPPVLFLNTRDKQPFDFTLGEDQTITGLDLAVSKLREGECVTIICKPQYAYGNFGNPQGFHSLGKPIPQNATLQFELDFLCYDPSDIVPVWKLETQQKVEEAQTTKNEGNEFFKKGFMEKACRKYGRAVECIESIEEESAKEDAKELLVTCYLNIAACRLKTDGYREVVSITSKVLKLQPQNVKALYRRGKAYSMLNENELAKDDLNQVLQLDKTNSEAKQELAKVQEKIKREKSKEKNFYGGMFNKLSSTDNSEPLYNEQPPEEPKTRKCGICGEELETIQWARHVIKKHGGNQ